MAHLFFGLTTAGVLALCALGILPPDQFVDLAKWLTILYAASTTMVAIVRHVWRRPATAEFDNLAVTNAPAFTGAVEGPWFAPEAQDGVGLPEGFGSLHGDVFSEPIGRGVPPNYTSMVRDSDTEPVTTDGADGAPVLVPVPHEYLGLLGVPAAKPLAPSPDVVVMGSPAKPTEG